MTNDVGADPEFTTCDNPALVELPLLPSPPYTAVIVCVPTVSADVAQIAVRMLPLPLTGAAAQPTIDAPPSRKLTLPVGALPLTVAVKVTLAPNNDGVCELAIPVVLVEVLIVCDSVELLDAASFASPLYAATMLCVPAASPLLVHTAVRLLPVPDRAIELHPVIELLPSLKLTVPVGLLPVTVAVNVTLAPKLAGLVELTSVVVVAPSWADPYTKAPISQGGLRP